MVLGSDILIKSRAHKYYVLILGRSNDPYINNYITSTEAVNKENFETKEK